MWNCFGCHKNGKNRNCQKKENNRWPYKNRYFMESVKQNKNNKIDLVRNERKMNNKDMSHSSICPSYEGYMNCFVFPFIAQIEHLDSSIKKMLSEYISYLL